MDKSSRKIIPTEDQAAAWDEWNIHVARDGDRITPPSRRQSERLIDRLQSLGKTDLNLIDVGCGTGWILDRIIRFGKVTGIDLSPASIERAKQRLPAGRFFVGDVFAAPLEPSSFDVVASLEVLSHVVDQVGFIDRIAHLLKPRGWVYIATQNKPVLERWSAIGGPIPGTNRYWVNHKELRALLEPAFSNIEIESVHPVGDQGLLRIVNSVKLNRLAELVISPRRIQQAKEKLMLGHSLIAWGRLR